MTESCEIKRAGQVEFRCYFQLAMQIIGGKWKPKVLFYLSANGTNRFGVLKRGIYGISEKMLIQSLKELERDGLVNRKVYRQVPPKVEYSLTDMGRSFIPVLDGMFDWGKAYASYLVSKENTECSYTPGTVLENIDEMVAEDA
ncbi:MAG: helix-turn-helix transcriptional regulator [Desulfobacterales bacterium]|nr:helix-turn-helix transcriptional regulator [Desulfobacterales bacterium]